VLTEKNNDMEQVVKLITDTLPVDCVCISELLDDGASVSLRAGFGFEEHVGTGKNMRINGRRAAVMSLMSMDGVVFDEADIDQCETVSWLVGGRSIKNGICMPIANSDGTSVWGLLAVCRDSNQCFNKKDVNFIRSMAESISFYIRELQVLDSMKSQLTSIKRAKKQWEAAVDSLPQLVIALNRFSEIIRVNRTAELWGIGKVNEARDSSLSSFIENIISGYSREKWDAEWENIWNYIDDREEFQWELDCPDRSRIFQFTLRKIQHAGFDDSHCFAILIVDDVTDRKRSEQLLKKYAEDLEDRIAARTLEIKQANAQLEHELQVQKRDKEALADHQACRQRLLRELITAQETERKRIACELHDSIGQSLGATKFKVEELLARKIDALGADERGHIIDIVDKIKAVIDEVRHIAMDLRPAMLDDLGVVATLKWFCREFEKTYSGISVNQVVNVMESDISHEMKVVIFRIVQEAMNNVVKHANATQIELELYRSVSGLKLCVSDNGRGFNHAFMFDMKTGSCGLNRGSVSCGFGLNSMCERAESTNGCFSVESIPEGGTSVRVVWE